MNLRGRSSLYDNIVEDVHTYSSELKQQFQISFQSKHREDVVATRDIIVGKHPLYEPGTPEYDEFVLGNDDVASSPLMMQQAQSGESDPNGRDSKYSRDQRETNQKKRRKKGLAPPVCSNLEWLDLFAGICLATSNRTKYSPEHTCGGVTDVEQMATWSAQAQVRTKDQDEKEEEEPQMFGESPSSPTNPAIQQIRVLYPIAKYPSRLNSPRLVEQRRKFLENQVSFKPLRLEARKPRKPKQKTMYVKSS